jgi:hypothetical protein
VNPVDDFVEPADSNGWHDTIADRDLHLTGRIWTYHTHRPDGRKPLEGPWGDDDGRDTPPRWADV